MRSWSDDVGLEGLVADLMKAWPALAFGVGLAFGLTFDTTGPTMEPSRWRRRRTGGADAGDGEPDDRRVRTREGEKSQPEVPPRSGEPPREE